MKRLINLFRNPQAKGQSLAETAIFLPILILLVAGVVEVSNILVTQNRLTTAARAASGFGASNFTGAEWDDPVQWSESMANVALNNVTETLDLEAPLWDIWAVKATVNDAGTAFEEWTSAHGYGNNSVVAGAEWATLEPQVKGDILTELQADGKDASDLEIVATVAYHDRNSILGIDFFDVGPFKRIRGLNVMRVDDPAPYVGCDLFPIAMRYNNHSVYPSNWTGGSISGYAYRSRA